MTGLLPKVPGPTARGVALLSVAFVFAAAALGCKKAIPSPSVHRVVSISPSTTEALFAIGAGGLVVGRSKDSDYPLEATKLPIVSGDADLNIESIRALKPDLVTGARSPTGNALSAGSALVDKLNGQSIAAFFPDTETFAQIDALLIGLGDRTGHRQEAKFVVAKLQAGEAAVARDVEGYGKPRVLLILDAQPIVAAGPKSFGNEMLVLAGSKNAVAEGGAHVTLDLERIIALDPEIVLDASASHGGASQITKDSPGWSRVRAVQDGHVIAITDETVLRPGPRVVDGLRALARAIHPNVVLQ